MGLFIDLPFYSNTHVDLLHILYIEMDIYVQTINTLHTIYAI